MEITKTLEKDKEEEQEAEITCQFGEMRRVSFRLEVRGNNAWALGKDFVCVFTWSMCLAGENTVQEQSRISKYNDDKEQT